MQDPLCEKRKIEEYDTNFARSLEQLKTLSSGLRVGVRYDLLMQVQSVVSTVTGALFCLQNSMFFYDNCSFKNFWVTFCYIRFFKGNFAKVLLDTVVELIRWHFPIRYCCVFTKFSHVFFDIVIQGCVYVR